MTVIKTADINDVRDYWNLRPCNIRHSQSDVGTREYFDEVEARRYLVEPHIPAFADFKRWRGKRVLEVGCGIGTDAVNFARAGAHVTAVDVSERSLDLCRKRFDIYGLKGTFYAGSAENLSHIVPVEPYDLVYSFGVVHHTPNPAMALLEMVKYVRPSDGITPNGEMRLMLYAKLSTKNLAIALGLAQPEAQAGCPIARTYTEREARNLVEWAGLRVRSIRKDHIFPYRIPEYVAHKYVKAFPWDVMPDMAFRACKRALGWHLLIQAERGRHDDWK